MMTAPIGRLRLPPGESAVQVRILGCPLPSLRDAGQQIWGGPEVCIVNLPPEASPVRKAASERRDLPPCPRVKGQRPRQEEGQSQLVTLQGLQPLQMCPKGG